MNTFMQFFHPSNPMFYIIIIWSLSWKGVALWHAARNKQLAWFIAILIINTVGIFDIIYLIFFKKDKSFK